MRLTRFAAGCAQCASGGAHLASAALAFTIGILAPLILAEIASLAPLVALRAFAAHLVIQQTLEEKCQHSALPCNTPDN